MANPLKHIKLPDDTILDLVGDNFYTQKELGQQISTLNVNDSYVSNIFTVTPEVIDILKDDHSIAGRIYKYKPNIYTSDMFNVTIDGNVNISSGNIGLLKLKYYLLTDSDIIEKAISPYAPNYDVKRGTYEVKSYFKNSDNPIINNMSYKGTPLSNNSITNYGSSGLSGKAADFILEGEAIFTDGDQISLVNNYVLDAASYIELYDDDNADFPFITSISKTSGFFTISGKNINSARLSTYYRDGQLVKSQMFNHVDNAIQVAQRQIVYTESILTKIEICNQLTFDAVHEGNFTIFVNNLSNTILNLS